MSNTAIRVENLSKQYRIGAQQQGGSKYKSLREELTKAVRAPIRRAGRLLRGEPYGAAELDETIWALKDVSFEIEHGEAVGIIGPNGAGKTTLLKILSRITEPTEGRAVLHGRVGSLLEVGTGFHPELTGRDNVYLSGAILGMRRAKIEEKFDEIVDFSGVEKFIDTPLKHYSSGMRVRLAFSVAAHLDPEILLIDEVLAVGDAAFQKKCLGKMGAVTRKGRTVLFVSHNMGAVQAFCQTGIVLEDGRVEFQGEATEAVAAYATCVSQRDSRHGARSSVSFSRNNALPVQILGISLTNGDGQARSVFEYHESPQVEILLEVREASTDYATVLTIRDSSALSVLHAYDRDSSSLAIADAPPGLYRYRVSLPTGSLLCPGWYSVSVRLKRQAHGGTRQDLQTHDSALTFEIMDAVSQRGTHIDNGRAAVLTPNGPWTLDTVK